MEALALFVPWTQISGAVAGGVVGGFSGFVANIVNDRREQARTRRNVAGALIGEIEGLSEQIGHGYFATIRDQATTIESVADVPFYQLFRGERDYIPIYRSVGVNFGMLPTPLPRKLVNWYTSLAVCLERAHDLHELARGHDPDWIASGRQLMTDQRSAFADLLSQAQDLIKDLSSL